MIGVITGRAIGGAVERNRARRLMREAFRLNRQKLKDNFQMIVVARTAIRGAGFTEVQAELLRLLRAAGMMMDS
jgi:ribonuclease P protein component